MDNINVPQLRFPEFKGEWKRKNLGEVATFSKGKGISKSDISENGITECIRYGELYTLYGETIIQMNLAKLAIANVRDSGVGDILER